MKDKIKQLNKAWKLMNEGINIISDIAFGLGSFELARKYGNKKI